jgi:hypothetical protein
MFNKFLAGIGILVCFGAVGTIPFIKPHYAQAKSVQRISDFSKAQEGDDVVKSGDLARAKVIFPITNVSRSSNIVHLTITKNARTLQSDSQKAALSAMKKTGTSGSRCPLINSTAINKEVRSYNPFSGQARLDAAFITEEMARKAAGADCLLIRNTE